MSVDEKQTHVLDLGDKKRGVIQFVFNQSEIIANVEIPPLSSRQARRAVQRWARKIFKRLDSDPRPMRITAFSNRQLVSRGYEVNGICGVTYYEK